MADTAELIRDVQRMSHRGVDAETQEIIFDVQVAASVVVAALKLRQKLKVGADAAEALAVAAARAQAKLLAWNIENPTENRG